MFEGMIDPHILLYVLISGGITELVMRKTPAKLTRKKFAIPLVFGTAMLASVLDGMSRDIVWSQIVFRGLVATALAVTAYDSIKSLISVFLKKVDGA
jgi:hypothetical protein